MVLSGLSMVAWGIDSLGRGGVDGQNEIARYR